MFDKTFLLQCRDCKNVFGSIFKDNPCGECKSKNVKLVLTRTE